MKELNFCPHCESNNIETISIGFKELLKCLNCKARYLIEGGR